MLPILFMAQAAAQDVPVVTPTSGMVITKTTKIRAGEYAFPSSDDTGATGVITIKGDNLTVDFDNAVFRGTPATTRPDERKGTFLLVEGNNVTIRKLKAHGYKIGIIARNSPGIRIIDCDLSYNWKQHLKSTLEREDTSDWMSFHRNEKDEWLRYGAAIYLRNCDNFEVTRNKVEGGQCGLMIMECNNGKIWNNNFSFLSAIGLGMYMSSNNQIMHNKIDWCVRGYSHEVYNRGQDSAGILIYEQSHKNVFAYNSVTHGGDGFFLWAGQTTMDTGQGGCNDNLLYGNDFSHAPTNGIEATFSRNAFVKNRIHECWHGIWGGYSYETLILGNDFADNDEAIAIEHGQDNVISYNTFRRDKMGIYLWWNSREDPNWGYPKNRDTRSRDYTIKDNLFEDVGLVFNFRDSQNVVVTSNAALRFDRYLRSEGNMAGLKFDGNLLHVGDTERSQQMLEGFLSFSEGNGIIRGSLADFRTELSRIRVGDRYADAEKLAPPAMRGGMNAFLPLDHPRGRKYILVDEWGPYDFKSPIIWPRTKLEDGAIKFELLGPKGVWKIVRKVGVESVSAESGLVPGELTVKLAPGVATDVDLQLEYVGEEVVSPFGVRYAKGQPYSFGYQKFFLPIDWTVKWFAFDRDTQDPRTQYEAWKQAISGPALAEVKTNDLNFAWGGRPHPNVPADYFSTVAEATVNLKKGTYTLNVTSDDGVRVWVDGKVVLENWTYHGPTLDTTTLELEGEHRIRVEHFELNGYSTLKVELIPKR